MTTITIDCGASFTKGAVFRDGALVGTMNRQSTAVHKDPSLFTIQQIPAVVEMVWQMIMELAGPDTEVSLCIANEMHGFILAYEDGTPFTDYISWQKELGSIPVEGKSACRRMTENTALGEHIVRSGMPLRAGLPSCDLYYLSLSGGLVQARGRLHFFTLGAYLLKMLSGGDEPWEHPTNAAATGLYDLAAGDWDRAYIAVLGGGEIVFPPVSEHRIMTFQMGSLTVHALPAIGDQQAALLGAGFAGTDALSFNLGTGAQVSRLVGALAFGTGHQIRPYFGGQYLMTVPHIPSGRALNVYFRFVKSVLAGYGFHPDDAEIWRGMLQAAENDTLAQGPTVDLSFFENALSDHVEGSIEKIKENDFTFESLMAAVLQQIAENALAIADWLLPDSACVRSIVFSGGVARRFGMIRERICSRYPQADVQVSANETMYGLYKYSML